MSYTHGMLGAYASVPLVSPSSAAAGARKAENMSEPEPEVLIPTTFGAAFVSADSLPPWLPAGARRQMAVDDLAARREAERLAAEAEDRREAVAFRCRQEGRDTSMSGVFGRADRNWRQTDYRSGPEPHTEFIGPDGRSLARTAPPPRRRWSDDEIAAEAPAARVRQYGRELDERQAAERAAADDAIARARAAHPPSGAWPAWKRPA